MGRGRPGAAAAGWIGAASRRLACTPAAPRALFAEPVQSPQALLLVQPVLFGRNEEGVAECMLLDERLEAFAHQAVAGKPPCLEEVGPLPRPRPQNDAFHPRDARPAV